MTVFFIFNQQAVTSLDPEIKNIGAATAGNDNFFLELDVFCALSRSIKSYDFSTIRYLGFPDFKCSNASFIFSIG